MPEGKYKDLGAKLFACVGIPAMVVSCSVLTYKSHLRHQEFKLDEVIKVHDTNGDGALDKTEYDPVFKEFDEDKDGFLDRNELNRYLQSLD